MDEDVRLAAGLQPEREHYGDQAKRDPLGVVEGPAEGIRLLGIAQEIVEDLQPLSLNSQKSLMI